ncbi:hypothetical protein M0813_06778 [Anaeramoeba flamelloides]|uniref:Uncharacterized protein n=1 Tax=Anaeramoeba flamelloides TaxID=1746091 RepID=A0ABQ8XGY0_9EUKA|nr:hypothetical protein M0813_06778 [Anaeramoeba flamelloides]
MNKSPISNPIKVIDFLIQKNLKERNEILSFSFLVSYLRESIEENYESIQTFDYTLETAKLLEGKIVRLTGMIQDNYELEYFPGIQIFNKSSKLAKEQNTSLITGFFRDDLKSSVLTLSDPQKTISKIVRSQEESESIWERSVFCCVQGPGETKWLQKLKTGQVNPNSNKKETEIEIEKKEKEKGIEIEIEIEKKDKEKIKIELEKEAETKKEKEENKKGSGNELTKQKEIELKLEKVQFKETEKKIDLEKHQSINNELKIKVKLYSPKIEGDQIMINEDYEFYGLLTINEKEDPNENENEKQMENEIEKEIEIVLHCCQFKKLDGNPFNGFKMGGLVEKKQFTDQKECEKISKDIVNWISFKLGGDKLLSKLLFLTIISHKRISLKKFFNKNTTNNQNNPIDDHFNKSLGLCSLTILKSQDKFKSYDFSQILQALNQLCFRVIHIPITIELLNKRKLVPWKDFEKNVLIWTELQVIKNTVICFDETKLAKGELNEIGLQNYRDIQQLIHKQKILYDFQYQKIPFDVNCPIIVFAQEKSLLKTDFTINWKPNLLKIKQKQIEVSPTEKTFMRWRNFIGFLLKFQFNSDNTKEEQKIIQTIQNYYVKQRKINSSININHFEGWLLLMELLSIVHLKSKISYEIWDKILKLNGLLFKRNK